MRSAKIVCSVFAGQVGHVTNEGVIVIVEQNDNWIRDFPRIQDSFSNIGVELEYSILEIVDCLVEPIINLLLEYNNMASIESPVIISSKNKEIMSHETVAEMVEIFYGEITDV